jgi:hypothetical protein
MLSMRRIFILLSFVLLVSAGCFHRKADVKTVPASAPEPAAKPSESAPAVPPAATPRLPAPLEPAPLATTITSPSNFELGEKNFRAGNYQQAGNAFDAYLKDNPKAKNRDQALFYLGLSRGLAVDSSRDMHQMEICFKSLISQFPNSEYKNQAAFILGLQVQNDKLKVEIDKLKTDIKDRDDRLKKLSEELKALKEIDLQRHPSRPE